MAVPTVPTVTSILTEAFRRCGVPSPTVAQLTRAEDEWFEEVKQELQAEKRWHALEDTQTVTSVASQQAYALPSPLSRVLRMRFVDASGQIYPMIGPVVGLQLRGTSPSSVSQYWEEFEGNILVWPIPNASTYTYSIDGVVDISLVDETDARLTRILREMRVALIAGVIVKIKEDQQDDDLPLARQRYEQLTLKLMKQDSRKRRDLLPTAMRGPGGLPRRRY